MIPHKLQLKNFLSYGSQLQTIDFSHHSLICLSGKNGHGKSALLDAITWAVWGQARKVIGAAKADEGLLRLGQTHMLVIFDFEFNGIMYRIRREYTQAHSKSVAVLEFGIVNSKNQEYIPLTDKTIRATQAKIEQTLRLNFEAFVNSAFLRQGNSNEFSKKAPKDRKNILASVLGLEQYEAIKKQALEKIKEANHTKNALMMLQEKRSIELAKQQELNNRQSTLACDMNLFAQEEQEWMVRNQQLQSIQEKCNQQQKEHDLLCMQKDQMLDIQSKHVIELHVIRSEWRTVNIKKHTVKNVQVLEQQKKKIVADIALYQTQFQKSLEYKEKLLAINHQLNTQEQQYKDSLREKQQKAYLEYERSLSEHTHKLNLLELLNDELKKNESEIQTVAAHINECTSIIEQQTVSTDSIQKKEALLEKRKNTYHRLISLGNVINNELKNSTQKKYLLDMDNPSCPLCEQNLSAARRRLLSSHFLQQESFFMHRLKRLKRVIPQLKEKLVQEHELLQREKNSLLLLQQQKDKKTELIKTQEKITGTIAEITTKIIDMQQEIQSLSEQLILQKNQVNEHSKAPNFADIPDYLLLVNEKTNLEEQLKLYTDTSETYNQKQSELKHIEEQINTCALLHDAAKEQPRRKHAIHELCVSLKNSKNKIKKLETELQLLSNVSDQYKAIQLQQDEHHNALKALQRKKDALLLLQGSIETEQKLLSQIKKEYDEEQKVIAEQNNIIQDYQIISTATGKDGIQALLIEEAIPEIEQEANQLLAQLTNNQAHVFIESLRDLKKGGTKETLDIKISDQNGIRPYELFSGGEAFRIDFALRIAISKLLARRAGTALQTLIIDEGFGSQDDEGLSYIMDAIHAIQSNFSKIIVVSHLPTMKDQFPVQFIIQKGVQGSTISVIEQG